MANFTIKTEQEIINNILVNIVANIDDVTDVNVGSVLRTLVEAFGIELSDIYTELQAIYDGTRIDTSTGTDLDNLGALLGITRKQGTKSQGYVSFIRNTPIAFDFTIASGSIISTQPNTGEAQLKFLVKNNTTFLSSITAESHKFINGLYNYAMNERFIDSISLLTGTSSGGAFTFSEGTDFQLVKDYNGFVIDPTSIILLDDCDAITDWNNSTGASAILVDNIDFKQGSGSLKLGKTTAVNDTVYYDKILGSVKDGNNKNTFLWLKIKDIATLNKLKQIKIMVGSNGSSTNSYSLTFDNSDLSVGWNMIKTDYTLSTATKTGFPNKSVMNYLRITLVTNNVSDLLVSGDVKMDFWAFGSSVDYVGDIIQFLQTGTIPDDTTNFLTSYKPLSKEVLCESNDVGVVYNVTSQKIIYKVSFIANVDNVNNFVNMLGATDIELDDDLRDRIKNATELKGKATVESLRQAVLGVEGVTSVSIDDMPAGSRGAEAYKHISFLSTPTQKLQYEVALNDIDFEVNGTRGGIPTLFVKNTDYFIQNSTINWVNDSLNPDDNTDFFVDYNYRWLGHVNIFVAGTSAPLPAEIVTNVDAAIYDTRSAGIYVTWAEPTIVTVPVTVNISVKSDEGYVYADVKVSVNDAIESFLNTKDTGSDVLLAEIIQKVMEVSGVLNTTVSLPGADVIIAVDEIARAGTITVNPL